MSHIQHMGKKIDSLPKKKYYVTMTDKFFSGGGRSKGKTNKLVIGTDNYEMAVRIQKKAKARSEMKYVNIATSKPYFTKNKFTVDYKSPSEFGVHKKKK
jgi:hypothetical protein